MRISCTCALALPLLLWLPAAFAREPPAPSEVMSEVHVALGTTRSGTAMVTTASSMS